MKFKSFIKRCWKKAYTRERKYLRKLLTLVSRPQHRLPYTEGTYLVIDATKQGKPICPTCKGKGTFYEGPQGGAAVNVRCRNIINEATQEECGATWNALFGDYYQPLDAKAKNTFDRIKRKTDKRKAQGTF